MNRVTDEEREQLEESGIMTKGELSEVVFSCEERAAYEREIRKVVGGEFVEPEKIEMYVGEKKDESRGDSSNNISNRNSDSD